MPENGAHGGTPLGSAAMTPNAVGTLPHMVGPGRCWARPSSKRRLCQEMKCEGTDWRLQLNLRWSWPAVGWTGCGHERHSEGSPFLLLALWPVLLALTTC